MTEQLSRRSFVAGAAATGAVLGLSASTLPCALAEEVADDGVTIINTCCTFDCGGRCQMKCHVKDGEIVRITSRGDYEDNEVNPNTKMCVRGRAHRAYHNHPERLTKPLKRVGKRGSGEFVEISWDEAVDYIVAENQRLIDQYGPTSRYVNIGTGDTGGVMQRMGLAQRFCQATGGYLGNYNSVSMGTTAAATSHMFGRAATGSGMETLLDTKLLVLWGHNTAETIFGASNYIFKQLKEAGCKIIVVDPRFSNTAAAFADQWIPVLPATDNALMDAMAYVIVSEGLQDQKFLDTYVLGFDEEHMPEGVEPNQSYRAYLFGEQDGQEKTPEWAEAICKVPAETIRTFAREYATAKPAALIEGWGPQRHANGEQQALGGAMLACLTGDVGVRGGWAGGYSGFGRKGTAYMEGLPADLPFENPSVPMSSGWIDAIEDYTAVTPATGLVGADSLTAPVKMIWNLASNFMMTSNPDINRVRRLLEDESGVECIITSDVVMTATALWSDIVLPAANCFERWNIGDTWNNGDYFIVSQKIVEPAGEARSEYDWLAECAEKMGVGELFTAGKTEEEWVRHIVSVNQELYPEDQIPDFEECCEQGFVPLSYDPEARVAFRDQIEDPQNNPFPTASGKIELFCQAAYDLADPRIPATPHYVPVAEGPGSELSKAYPLQLIAWKSKARNNSGYATQPWLVQTQAQELWINPIDADARGIADGDVLKVFNDRGACKVAAKVTQRIVPGCVALPNGAWYNPDEDGVCQNGCINVLTSSATTPWSFGNTQHTNLVEVQKY